MKSVLIIYNQANTERVEFMLDKLGIRGFTFFEQVQGRGTKDGDPHRGSHTWPEMNSAIITVIEESFSHQNSLHEKKFHEESLFLLYSRHYK